MKRIDEDKQVIPQEGTSSSFIITGPSASGKTTLARIAWEQGYAILPTHTTRPLRTHEKQGLDILNITEQGFISNFESGNYLEPDLNFALLHSTGTYYGTPVTWLRDLSENGKCAMPVSLTVARRIARCLPISWVHLECPDEIRRERLCQRGISDEEVDARLYTGESREIPSEATIIFNSAELSTAAIFNIIQEGNKL